MTNIKRAMPLSLILAYFLLSSQTCSQVHPTKCNNLEVFYGPLVETYGPTGDGNSNQQDRFYLANLYYKSNNNNFTGIQIEFNLSSLENVANVIGTATSSDPSNVEIRASNPLNISGNNPIKLASIVWRVKYTDFGTTAIGKQKFTFLDGTGLAFEGCQPSFIDPPSVSRMSGQIIPKPNDGYILPSGE
ncbi:hypothetical protein [Portibacter lacus]|nr:hypothetical protein [Portibacter lacus]